jgi:DNA-binding phage protein
VTPAQAVMDRLAAYLHWNDLQALDQALAVVRRQQIDWERLEEWARQEGLSRDVLDRLKDASHD